MVVITEKAATELRSVLEKENKQGYSLRIFMAGLGCCGPRYGLALEEAPREVDRVTKSNGVKIVLDENIDSILKDAEIDYLETEYGAGFVINNANYAGGCGPSCSGCD